MPSFDDTVSPWTALSPSRPHRLPMGTAFGATDIGPVRKSNEDNFLIDEALGLVMVADGMGGHACGEVASAGALEAVRDYLALHGAQLPGQQDDPARQPRLEDDPDATWSDLAMRAVALAYDAIEFANRALYAQNLARGRPESGMGTTLTGFWRAGPDVPLVLFHIGDSRLYRLRGGRLDQLTRDQTMYQQAIDAGLIDNLPARNLLLQAMGPDPRVTPEVRAHLVEPGDLLMLCSDGLHGSVPHGEIEAVMAVADEPTLASACRQLIALAVDYGGRDNITVVMALYRG
ncbi:MAG: Serine/threonine protein phosphatase [Massilia sp.]|nr:Serine/threonine protein phosphatase [Massilia sp.]